MTRPKPKTVRAWAWAFSWRKKTIRNGRARVSFHNSRDSARYWLEVHQKDGFTCGPVTRVSVEVPAPKERKR